MKQVDRLQGRLDNLKKTKNDLLLELQDNCEHPISEVREAEYESSWISTLSPFRVCLKCGYAEEGWHCGYWKLHRNKYGPISDGEILGMSRKEARKHVRTFLTQGMMSEQRFNRQ